MYRFLRSWRILGLVFFIYLEIVQFYIFARVDNSYFWRPLYFTYTGWYYFGIYSCLIVYSHYLHDIEHRPFPTPSESIWQLWKLCTLLFELGLIASPIITAGFWLFLWPLKKERLEWDSNQFAIDTGTHGGPMLFLIVDLLLNQMPLEKVHFCFAVWIGMIYVCMNFTATIVRDEPVYHFFDLRHWELWIGLVMFYGAYYLVFLGLQ